MTATLTIAIPKLGVLVPVFVFVPDGDHLRKRIETCARLTVVAIANGQGGRG